MGIAWSRGKELLFWDREFSQNTRQEMYFLLVHSPSETYLREGFLPSKTALIREKQH